MARDYETNRSQTGAMSSAQSRTKIDEGLRTYMLSVYNYMTMGLGITGLVAYLTASSPALLNLIFTTPLQWVVMLGPLGFVFYLSARINRISSTRAQTLFWIYSAMMGLSLSFIFIAYTEASIIRVLFITAGTFASMSLYGYTTKRDLSGMGSFLFMGLIGLILASVVNMFLASSALDFAISAIGVLIFVGLTAYDTQKIKHMYSAADSDEIASKKAIIGALRLYLDFINLFLFLLRFLGGRR